MVLSSRFVTRKHFPPKLPWSPLFCVGVTFEMRTVLYGIHLFNDNSSKDRHHIYIKQKEGKESKIAERQRESVCERDGVWQREEVV